MLLAFGYIYCYDVTSFRSSSDDKQRTFATQGPGRPSLLLGLRRGRLSQNTRGVGDHKPEADNPRGSIQQKQKHDYVYDHYGTRAQKTILMLVSFTYNSTMVVSMEPLGKASSRVLRRANSSTH